MSRAGAIIWSAVAVLVLSWFQAGAEWQAFHLEDTMYPGDIVPWCMLRGLVLAMGNGLLAALVGYLWFRHGESRWSTLSLSGIDVPKE